MLNKKHCLAFSLFFLFLENSAYADYDLDYELNRTLIMQCDYSDYAGFQLESISIRQRTVEDIAIQPASVKVFKKSDNLKFVKPFLINSGQFAECIYPSGTRVRVKVGEGASRPYGECGGDADVFMSLWVNKRKIAYEQFSGHCWGDRGRENYAISFKVNGNVSGNEKSVYSVEKCHTALQKESSSTFVSEISKQIPPKPPLSVCVDFPTLSKFPHDFIEYPRIGIKLPKAGDIQLLKGSDKVCQAVRNELKADFFTFGRYPKSDVMKLSRPQWNPTAIKLSEKLYNIHESSFDFDNDGKLDRVFEQSFENNYMDGSVLVVQYGHSKTALKVSATPLEKASGFFPCQMDAVPRKIMDCPPFPDSKGEGNFLVKGRTAKESVYFRGRYTHLSPFMFQGTHFLGVDSRSGDTMNYVAVLKPLPNQKFQQMCLFQRVAENF